MRMKCLRILPETMPRISCFELSSLRLNIALGSAVVTVASTSIGSDFATSFSPLDIPGEWGRVPPSGPDGTGYGMGKRPGQQDDRCQRSHGRPARACDARGRDRSYRI